MPVPQGWEWLDDVPDEWEPPEDLLGPSKAVELNIAIRILSCDFLGKEICALVGQFITEQSLYTMWFYRDVKGSDRDLKRIALLSGVGHEQARLVFEAWERFQEGAGSEGTDQYVRAIIRARGAELQEALHNAVTVLAATRSGTA